MQNAITQAFGTDAILRQSWRQCFTRKVGNHVPCYMMSYKRSCCEHDVNLLYRNVSSHLPDYAVS